MTEIGLIDTVTIDENRSRIWLQVFLGPGREPIDVPFLTPMSGLWIVPEAGQLVEVYEVGPGTRAARYPHSNPSHSLPSGLSEGDFALTTDSGTSLLVKSNGNIELSASGDVIIDGIDFDAHTHDYEDELSDGTTTTKTTQAPQ